MPRHCIARPVSRLAATSPLECGCHSCFTHPQMLRYVRKALAEVGYPQIDADPEVAASRRGEPTPLGPARPAAARVEGIYLMDEILAVADAPGILLSAYGRNRVVSKAFDSRAIDYIVRPFSPTELVPRVKGDPAKECWHLPHRGRGRRLQFPVIHTAIRQL